MNVNLRGRRDILGKVWNALRQVSGTDPSIGLNNFHVNHTGKKIKAPLDLLSLFRPMLPDELLDMANAMHLTHTYIKRHVTPSNSHSYGTM